MNYMFAGMTSALDEAVGNITDVFRKAGMWEDTDEPAVTRYAPVVTSSAKL